MIDDYLLSSNKRQSKRLVASPGFDDQYHVRAKVQAALGQSAALDTPDDDNAEQSTFSLGRVQYTLPSRLTHLCCSNNVLLLAVASKPNPQLVAISLDRPDEENVIDILSNTGAGVAGAPGGASSPALHRLFFDPTARHILAAFSSGDTYYVNLNWAKDTNTGRRKAKALARFKGLVVESVAWNYANISSTSNASREILIGTSDGKVYESWLDGELEAGSFRPIGRGSSHDRYMRPVLTLPDAKEPILGLQYHMWHVRANDGHRQNHHRKIAVVLTTPSRILQYIAAISSDESIFETLGQAFRDVLPKTMDLPADPGRAEMHVWRNTDAGYSKPASLAWLTNPGIYHGHFVFSSQEAGDGVIESAHLVPYPVISADAKESSTPVSIALTAHHFIMLYPNGIRISRILDDKLVFHDTFTDLDPGTIILGLVTDTSKSTYWVATSTAIYEIGVEDEARDIWRVYLKRNAFDAALQYAKKTPHRDLVLIRKADALFNNARYLQAADLYAQTSKSFGDVVLNFVERDERDALRSYLSARLSRLSKSGDKTQRLMLATWLLESFLAKLNHLEDVTYSEADAEQADNLKLERSIVDSDLKDFLSSHKDDLDRNTVYDLTESHGRLDIMVTFAGLVNDSQRLILHYIQDGAYLDAIDCLNKQFDLEPYYTYASTLVRHAAVQTVACLMRRSELDVAKLLPGLLAGCARSTDKTVLVCKYLRHTIMHGQNSADTIIYNALIALYASTPGIPESELLEFISASPVDPISGQPYYDIDYALRVCRANKRLETCVHLYGKMEMPASAVSLALELNDIQLARMSVDKVDLDGDGLLRKKLWLKIAQHVVRENKDIKTAMKLLEGAHDVLKVEDILPFFPDFVVIDDFKEEICQALENYAAEIEALKEDMREATANAELIKKDIADLSTRLLVVDANDKCVTCLRPLLSRQFYVFPCQHGFHADCLVHQVTEHVSPAVLRRIIDLQNQLSRLSTADSPDAAVPETADSTESNALLSNMVSALGLKPIAKSKLTTASLQSMDQLRKLVVPDALVSVIGAGAEGLMAGVKLGTGSRSAIPVATESSTTAEKLRVLRAELDDILASSCVLCDRSLALIDRPFVMADEEEM